MPLEPGQIALMIPILIFMIPIVAILTSHQQKMAELVRRQNPVQDEQLAALRMEVQELKALVHQQAIALDNFIASQPRLTPPASPIEQRLNN